VHLLNDIDPKKIADEGGTLILEIATINIEPGQEAKYEAAFAEAGQYISSMYGYISHELQRCVEDRNRYIVLVKWQQLQDHTVGFRESENYQKWRALIHPYFAGPPEVKHYELV